MLVWDEKQSQAVFLSSTSSLPNSGAVRGRDGTGTGAQPTRHQALPRLSSLG